MHKILITGANGQLGWELGQLAATYPAFEFVLVDRSQLDLSFPETFEKIIQTIAPDCIVNTAAYTAVDKSETEKELSYTVNAELNATAETTVDAQITRIISAEMTATAQTSVEAGIGVTFVSSLMAAGSVTDASLFRTATLAASVSGAANTTSVLTLEIGRAHV
jgi:NAD(P)-dependent dehydrogenase (short-subunit alcohol dehydrogenase family)